MPIKINSKQYTKFKNGLASEAGNSFQPNASILILLDQKYSFFCSHYFEDLTIYLDDKNVDLYQMKTQKYYNYEKTNNEFETTIDVKSIFRHEYINKHIKDEYNSIINIVNSNNQIIKKLWIILNEEPKHSSNEILDHFLKKQNTIEVSKFLIFLKKKNILKVEKKEINPIINGEISHKNLLKTRFYKKYFILKNIDFLDIAITSFVRRWRMQNNDLITNINLETINIFDLYNAIPEDKRNLYSYKNLDKFILTETSGFKNREVQDILVQISLLISNESYIIFTKEFNDSIFSLAEKEGINDFIKESEFKIKNINDLVNVMKEEKGQG